jgi:two-component system, chemotaxis family, chemotaxis protein CheY
MRANPESVDWVNKNLIPMSGCLLETAGNNCASLIRRPVAVTTTLFGAAPDWHLSRLLTRKCITNAPRRREGQRTLSDRASLPILLVDDYPAMRRVMRTLLLQLGFANIDFATDGLSALQKLREQSYSLIISDFKMEPMSGLGLLREVRREERLRNVPFILITAYAGPAELAAAMSAGVSDCLAKPFTSDVLRKKIENLLPDCRPSSVPAA